MPKIQMLSRNPDDYLRETKKDIHKVPRNYDPKLHPFEASREYSRALNAVKLERLFAKPFLGSLGGHHEGVQNLCKHPTSLSTVLSGSYDGEIRIWNLARRKCIGDVMAHEGHVRGICFNPNGEYFFTCGDDKTVKQWSLDAVVSGNSNPQNTILGKTLFHGMDHHWSENKFVTCGEKVDVWDEERTEPIRSFSWGHDSVISVRCNPVEHQLIGATGMDRSILLYDIRGVTPLRKVIMKMRSNTLIWNPMEAFVFAVANEDHNVYTFDMRNLQKPLNIHGDHTSAVLDIDFSPTGKEFVSGSYDRTLRIFQMNQIHSREIYHTKRMQRVVCVKWSMDSKYILSGSDEMNLRLWKANASEKLGLLKPREKEAFNYSDKLKEKFEAHPMVSRIKRHRHVPKAIINETRKITEMKQARRRKELNKKTHSKRGTVKLTNPKKAAIVGEME